MSRAHLVAVRAILGALSAFRSDRERRYVLASAASAADIEGSKDLRSCCPDAGKPNCHGQSDACDCPYCEWAATSDGKFGGDS